MLKQNFTEIFSEVGFEPGKSLSTANSLLLSPPSTIRN